MKKETRLNTAYAGITMAALGVLCAWEETKEFVGTSLAPRAGAGHYVPYISASAHNNTLLISSATLLVTGIGLALFAALYDRRLK